MRRVLVIITCGLVMLAIAGAFLSRSSQSTAPDVNITLVSLTNLGLATAEAEFQIVNRGNQRIQVLNAMVTRDGPDLDVGGRNRWQPFAIEAGGFHKLPVSVFAPGLRWRATVKVKWDTPRFRDWLSNQPWQKYLPRSWQCQKVSAYIFSSPWLGEVPTSFPHGLDAR
jgi:hypothetical protein